MCPVQNVRQDAVVQVAASPSDVSVCDSVCTSEAAARKFQEVPSAILHSHSNQSRAYAHIQMLCVGMLDFVCFKRRHLFLLPWHTRVCTLFVGVYCRMLACHHHLPMLLLHAHTQILPACWQCTLFPYQVCAEYHVICPLLCVLMFYTHLFFSAVWYAAQLNSQLVRICFR